MGRSRSLFLWVVVLLLCAAGGCGSGDGEKSRTRASTQFDANKSLFGAIREATQLALYEGLPREGQGLEEERQTKQTVTLHGHPFYAAPLNVATEDREKLQ